MFIKSGKCGKGIARLSLFFFILSCPVVISTDVSYAEGEGSKSTEAKSDEWVVAKKRGIVDYDFSAYTADNEIRFTMDDGEAFKLNAPAFKRDAELWIPINALLGKLGVVLLKADENNFGIIRKDGTPLEFAVNDVTVRMAKEPFMTLEDAPRRYGGNFYLSASSLAKVSEITYIYDEPTDTVKFSSAKPGVEEFFAFSVEKPIVPEELKPKPFVIKPLPAVDVREEMLPVEYARDIDLKVDTTFSYLEDKHAKDRTRQLDLGVGGTVYDYNLDGRLRMRDMRGVGKQRFREDGQFLQVYRDPVRLKALDNYFTIPKLRSQSQPYWGVEFTDIYAPFGTALIAGRMENTVSGPAAVGAVKYFGDVYALRQDFEDSHNLFKVSNMFLWQESYAESQFKSSTTNYPRRNMYYLIDTTTYLYPGLTFDYTHGFSNYEPDNKVNKRLQDGNYRFGVSLDDKLYTFRTGYERVGQQYASIGIPSTYQDFEGWDATANFKFAPNWQASLGTRINRNNIERNPKVQTNYDNSLYGSTGIYLPWRQNINLSYSATEYTSRGDTLDLSGNRFKDWRADYFKTWNNTTLQLSYDHLLTSPRGISTGGSFTDAYSMNIFQFYPAINNSNIRFYQDMRKTKTIADASYVTTLWGSDLGGRLNITEFLSATADCRIAITTREAFQDTAFTTLLLGGEYRSSLATTWNIEFSMSNYDLYNPKNQTTKFYTILYKVRHVFDVETPEKWGRARVFVYRDLNSNGKYDAGEPGIPNVRVNIVNGRQTFTNTNGIAIIYKVVPGNRKVKVDLSSLPLDMAVRGASPVQDITITTLKMSMAEFPIVLTGKFKGMVYIDDNKNGKYDYLEDEGIPNVRVYTMPSGKETLTFSDGSFYLEYIYPGEHEVAVDLSTVPSDYTISSPEKINVVLKEGESREDLDFSFSARPIEVQQFGSR